MTIIKKLFFLQSGQGCFVYFHTCFPFWCTRYKVHHTYTSVESFFVIVLVISILVLFYTLPSFFTIINYINY